MLLKMMGMDTFTKLIETKGVFMLLFFITSCINVSENCDKIQKSSENTAELRKDVFENLNRWAGGNIYSEVDVPKKGEKVISKKIGKHSIKVVRYLHPNDVLKELKIGSADDFNVLFQSRDSFDDIALVQIKNTKAIKLNSKFWEKKSTSDYEKELQKNKNGTDVTFIKTQCESILKKPVFMAQNSAVYEVNFSSGTVLSIISDDSKDPFWGKGCAGAICGSSYTMKMILEEKSGLLYIHSSDATTTDLIPYK